MVAMPMLNGFAPLAHLCRMLVEPHLLAKRGDLVFQTFVAADVAGYCRLIRQDEDGTIRILRAHRADLIDPLTEEHGAQAREVLPAVSRHSAQIALDGGKVPTKARRRATTPQPDRPKTTEHPGSAIRIIAL